MTAVALGPPSTVEAKPQRQGSRNEASQQSVDRTDGLPTDPSAGEAAGQAWARDVDRGARTEGARTMGAYILKSADGADRIDASYLSQAAASLAALATSPDLRQDDCAEVVRRLRHAAKADRGRGPPEALLADLVANALAFTPLERLGNDDEARAALLRGYD